MARIHKLKITHFRGIDSFEQSFIDSNFVCVIGRGDSGKSTILKAISLVLSPNWNVPFYDSDFFDMDTNTPIEIEASIVDVSEELLVETKYGLHKQFLTNDNQIIDDVLSDEFEYKADVLTIKLVVTDDLEPKWYVVNKRMNQEPIEIGANDRSKFNTYLVSDYMDNHFSFSKGSPLYKLLNQKTKAAEETHKILIDSNRKAKEVIGRSNSYDSFNSTNELVADVAKSMGLDVVDLKTLLDFKEFTYKESNVTLHSDNIPFRLRGKGSKRLLSVAIQMAVAQQGGIILIDEIEQGLEPDRVKSLVRQLKKDAKGQIFITTHSSNVIVELDAADLYMSNPDKNSLFRFNSDFQGCLRAHPEAFFAKRIIVCEGATEVGICRALDCKLVEDVGFGLSYRAIAIIDGQGTNFPKYALTFKKAGFEVCTFNDDDNRDIDTQIKDCENTGIKVISCERGNSIEAQLFKDLKWNQVKSLVEYAISEKSEQSILDTCSASNINELINPDDDDKPRLRLLFSKKSVLKDKEWFKRIDHGQVIGKVWFDGIAYLNTNSKLKYEYDELIQWIKRDV